MSSPGLSSSLPHRYDASSETHLASLALSIYVTCMLRWLAGAAPQLPCRTATLQLFHVQVVLTEPPKSSPIEVVVDLDAKSVTSFKKVCALSLHQSWF